MNDHTTEYHQIPAKPCGPMPVGYRQCRNYWTTGNKNAEARRYHVCGLYNHTQGQRCVCASCGRTRRATRHGRVPINDRPELPLFTTEAP